MIAKRATDISFPQIRTTFYKSLGIPNCPLKKKHDMQCQRFVSDFQQDQRHYGSYYASYLLQFPFLSFCVIIDRELKKIKFPL